jgi:hypothetical protein
MGGKITVNLKELHLNYTKKKKKKKKKQKKKKKK